MMLRAINHGRVTVLCVSTSSVRGSLDSDLTAECLLYKKKATTPMKIVTTATTPTIRPVLEDSSSEETGYSWVEVL